MIIPNSSFKYRSESESNPTPKRLAHFYRACHIFPSFDPARVLGATSNPLTRTSAKSLFLGGSGKLNLKVSSYRAAWVAGQQCWLNIWIQNDTTKRVKTLTFTLFRNATTFRILPQLNPGGKSTEVDIDSCETSTSRRKLAEVLLDSGTNGSKGAVTGKGWWCGVDARSQSKITHGISLPVRVTPLGMM